MYDIVLFRDRHDSTYRKYLSILTACKEVGINPPKEVDDYFGGNGIDNDPDYPLEIEFQPRKWTDGNQNGYEFNLSELPDGIKTIRFYTDHD